MPTIDELRKIRLKKLAAIRKAGIEPYPARTKRTHPILEALADFAKLAKAKREIVLTGRIRSVREHGGSVFLHFEDGSGLIQAYLKRDKLGPQKYQFFLDNFDIGDIVEIKGNLFKTKKGEKTIEADECRLLVKALLPLPEKWHGLQDIEERYRKRYLDLIMNKEVRRLFERRSEIVKKIREFLDKNGFIEVETPMLQPLYGGANAKPFKTRLNALKIDLYLRIAPELYLKRLLVAGMERIYEIGRCFRNEGMDREHNPDFTMLEWYAAYWDWEDLMKFTENLMYYIAPNVFPKNWSRVNYNALVKKGQDPKTAYKKLKKPTFVLYLPNIPLAKNGMALQGVVQGAELIKAFTEQNNPLDQRKALEEQERLLKKGDEEAQRLDEDFLEALEYGMPPAAGFGMGIDRLVALLTNSHALREVILFPTMKPKNS